MSEDVVKQLNSDEFVSLVMGILEGKSSIVYFLRCNEFVKIGTSSGDYFRRLVELQCGNPYRLELEIFVLGSYETESRFHKMLKKKKERGEWYRLTKEEVKDAIKEFRTEQGN